MTEFQKLVDVMTQLGWRVIGGRIVHPHNPSVEYRSWYDAIRACIEVASE